MSKRKTFNDFNIKLKPGHKDFLVGFDAPEIGGEKKFQLSHLKDFVHGVEIHKIEEDGPLPIVNPDPTELDILPEGEPDQPPFLNGKIFHAVGSSDVRITLPKSTEFPVGPDGQGPRIQCLIVNLTDNKRVEIHVPEQGTNLYAKGVGPDLNRTYLKRRYDTAMLYCMWKNNGIEWYGHGDLDGPSSLHIKNVETSYTFTPTDEDKILHFNHVTDAGGVLLTLPDPTSIPSGTQFFARNHSDEWIELRVPDGMELKARAKFLRRKFDDVAIYTDGVDWFATGDLS